MTYIPHEWESNELITHEKLNHMEDGIEEANNTWDAVIRLTHANNSGGDDAVNLTPSIESGSFDALSSIISNGGIPRILVEYNNPFLRWQSTSLTAVITYVAPALIQMVIAGYFPTSEEFTKLEYLGWTDSDTIVWD